MGIQLNDFKRQWEAVREPVLAAVERVGSSGFYILGDEVKSFEQSIAQFAGFAYAVGVANGQDALEIALRCVGIGPGHRVLTTPLSAFATTLAILRTGAIPVFVDTDRYGLLDLGMCSEVLSQREDISCLLPVHLYGHAIDSTKLSEIRKRFSILLIEDCAQNIGARWRGTPTGAGADLVAISFYPTKNLGALGDAGAVLTQSDQFAERARFLRNYGQSSTYIHDFFGLNSRLDELHAAILNDAMLSNLMHWEKRRAEIANRYCCEIANPSVFIPGQPFGSESVWHLFPVLVSAEQRTEFRSYLSMAGVSTGLHYPRLITEQKALLEAENFEVLGSLENARRFTMQEVSLPVHPFLSDAEVAQVIEACNKWEAA